MYLRTEKTDYDRVYNRGLKAEQECLGYLAHLTDMTVIGTDLPEDQFTDIDVYLDGEPWSIKTQQTGYKYGHLCLELGSQRGYGVAPLSDSDRAWLSAVCPPGPQVPPGYLKGWWFTGRPLGYVIWQGPCLYLIEKAALAAHVTVKGFLRVRGLNSQNLKMQGGKNTYCGYIDMKDVPWTRVIKLRP